MATSRETWGWHRHWVLRGAAALSVIVGLGISCTENRSEPRLDAVVSYLSSRIATGDPRRFVLLHHLSETYQDERMLGIARPFGAQHCAQLSRMSLGRFCGLIPHQKEPVGGSVEAEGSPSDRLLVAALRCRPGANDQSLLEAIRSAIRQGGYTLTHAGMASWIAFRRDCFSSSAHESLVEAHLEPLIQLIESEQPNTDLGIEALAVLFALGGEGYVRTEWIDTAVSSQNPDGGWPAQPHEGSWDHTSVLG